MKSLDWQRIFGLRKIFSIAKLEPAEQAERIVRIQRNIVQPTRLGIVSVVVYFMFYSGWFYEPVSVRSVVQDTLKGYFLSYVAVNVVVAVVMGFWQRIPPGYFQWVSFTLGLLDVILAAGLVIVTGGFESIMFWVFPWLIVLNAFSIPLATPQIVLNFLLSFFFVCAGLLQTQIPEDQLYLLSVPRSSSATRSTEQSRQTNSPATHENTAPRARSRIVQNSYFKEPEPTEIPTGLAFLQTSVLWLVTVCCYSVQVLLERQRRDEEEAHEMGLRQGQLRSAGRIAAEFAHQIKNPLAIINNAAFSLQRALKDGRDGSRPLQIIQEEIERSDKIIERIMGYAQLNEGRVEKLNLVEEFNKAIAQVFPPHTDFKVKIEKRFDRALPSLLMQRNHLEEILTNILLNAREAMGDDGGKISITAQKLSENLLEITISDSGPGIPEDQLERIFEPNFTTKKKGTGLGLAIVKHNTELYAGTIRAESKLGKGARFVLVFPAKTVIK
jgi:signal transduction histidine kinase